MATEDLLDHFKLEAEVYPNYTVHSKTRFNRRRGVRERTEVKWKRLERIGDGAFGQVWLEAHRRSDGTRDTRAIKMIEKHKMRAFRIDYKKELLALAKFSKNEYREAEVLVSFLGWFETEQTIFLAMEYFKQGDLARHISQISEENEVKQITTDLLEGLKIIHAEGFAHRDLKPQNIFVVERPPQATRWWVKIGDFGISKRVKDDSTALRTQTGTPLFQAPEIWGFVDEDSETSVYSKAVDLWSLGCIVYNISAGQVPFARSNDINLFCRNRTKLAEEPLHRVLSAEGIWFVKRLLVPEPDGRMSIERAANDSWLIASSTPEFSATVVLPKPDVAKAIASTNQQNETLEVTRSDLKISETDTSEWKTMNTTSTADHFLQNTANDEGLAEGTSSEFTEISIIHQGAHTDINIQELTQAVSDTLILSNDVTAHKADDQTSMPELHVPLDISSQSTKTDDALNRNDMTTAGEGIDWQISSELQRYGLWFETFVVHKNESQVVCASRGSTGGLWGIAKWDIISGKRVRIGRSLTSRQYPETSLVALSPDGELGAFDEWQEIVVCDVFRGKQLHRLRGHKGKIKVITFSRSGQWLATGSIDCTIRVWDVLTGQLYRSFVDHTNVIVALTFSTDHNLVVSGSADRSVRLWDTANAKWPQSYSGHTDDISSVAMSPDGSWIASNSVKRNVLLWDTAKGLLHQKFLLGESVCSIAFSDDSSLLACGLRGGSILLFSVHTGNLHATLKGSTTAVRTLAFVPQVGILLSGHDDGSIRRWTQDRTRI